MTGVSHRIGTMVNGVLALVVHQQRQRFRGWPVGIDLGTGRTKCQSRPAGVQNPAPRPLGNGEPRLRGNPSGRWRARREQHDRHSDAARNTENQWPPDASHVDDASDVHPSDPRSRSDPQYHHHHSLAFVPLARHSVESDRHSSHWFGLNRQRVCLRRGGEEGIEEASCRGTTELAADRWHHVAVVVRETADSMRRVLFYVDGALDAAVDLERPPGSTQAQALSDWRQTHGPAWQGCYTVPVRSPPAGEFGNTCSSAAGMMARPPSTERSTSRRYTATPRRLDSAPGRGRYEPIPARGRGDPVGGDPAPIRWLLGPLHGV